MLKSTKAISAITYGLLTALIIGIALSALTIAGVGVENVFSLTGNTIAATMSPSGFIGSPNPNLDSEQQSEITSAAAEIAAGTASAACLSAMQADAANMSANSSTCRGPGYGIAPPPLPVEEQMIDGHNAEVMTNGNVYAVLVETGIGGGSWNMNSYSGLQTAQNFIPSYTSGGNRDLLLAYTNGYIESGPSQTTGSDCGNSHSGFWENPPGGVINNGRLTYNSSEYGICSNAAMTSYSYNGTATAANPLGTGAAW